MGIEFSQTFTWHAKDKAGKYQYGRDGYLVMDGSSQLLTESGIQCQRLLQKPITNADQAIEVCMRVTVGRAYEICLRDNHGSAIIECVIQPDGWVKFRTASGWIDPVRFLTWFKGRPCVDPAFVPGTTDPRIRKTIESDEHRYRFGEFDFKAQAFTFTFDNELPVRLTNCFRGPASEIVALELIAEPSAELGNQIRLRRYYELLSDQVVCNETFPIFWEAMPAIPHGYPDDCTRQAVTRPLGNRWLECTGEYGWVKARLPFKFQSGELEFLLETTDVQKESCVELHEHDGTMAQSMWPIKIGILQGKFFAGFASKVTSAVLGRSFWQSQQAWFLEIVPQPNRPYRIRMAWDKSGTYHWSVDGVPMIFSGVAKSGKTFTFRELKIPGHEIPFLNEDIQPAFGGIDTIGLHFGLVTPASHQMYFADMKIAAR